MPPSRVARRGTTARGGRNARRGRNERENNEGSQHGGNLGNQNDRPPRANTSNRAMEVVREFRKLNPPMFDGVSSDPLVTDHWLSEIHKLFDVLDVTEDADMLWEQFERLEQGTMTVLEYAMKFQALSRFAPELVSTEEKKCKRPPTTIVSAPTGSSGVVSGNYGNQNKKRQGEQLQFSRNHSTFRAPTSSGFGGNSSRPPMTCHQCFVHSGEVLVMSPVRFSSRDRVLGLVNHHRGVETRKHTMARLLQVRAHRLIERLVLPCQFRLHRDGSQVDSG
ncbi:hypothetical protein Acr_27g0002920 [Actinidia rufa]|uniref:Retrotransposon gag domain-containing protein n=1 Tax=Actinidia rufa TaxID=165716 RepID=A0A7J0H629_9ERIC|nr:hypothetical protein Acr_27g0002920 [Actinidia rufa]